MGPTIDDYRWLVSDVAKPWLALARHESSLIKLTALLRKELSAPRAHLVIEQTDLRQRARDKFSRADRMFFTRKGLEQATDEQLARYKASRFAGEQPIFDLCCGIGGDLLALASGGKTHGIDRDEATVLLAVANAAAYGFSADQCDVSANDIIRVSLRGYAWHCDPDRRKDGRRATRGELFEPPLESLDNLLAQSSAAAIKLAPATEAPPGWRQTAELQWLSSRGECRQQVAWFGPLARHVAHHAATIVDAGCEQRTVIGSPDQPVPTAVALGRYIYEPDAAVLAARLSAVLCSEHELAAVSPGIAYLTGDAMIHDIALDGFEVIDILPFDRKQLRGYCRKHGLGRLEIKKRGVDLSPEQLRKEIATKEDGDATVIVTRIHNNVRAIFARRIRN